MGDMGDVFNEWKKEKQQRRASHRDNAAKELEKYAIYFESKNGGAHLIVEGPSSFIDYWPGTGRWIPRDTKQRQFGLRNLLKYILGNKDE